MAISAVVVNRPWDEAIGEALCPQPHPSVAEVAIDDVVVLTHPLAERALALEPLSTVLWRSFDGRTPLQALADDLVDSVGLTPDDARTQLDGMCRWLGWRGFLAEPHVPEALRHDWFPALDDDACPAQKMGLAAATLLDVDLGDRTVRVGATDERIVAELRAAYAERVVAPDADAGREIVCANLGTPQGPRRPRHRVVDHWGNLLHTGRSRTVAATALVRLLDDRIAQSDGGTWLRTPVLLHDGRAVVVHRGLEGGLDRAMPRLERDGYRLYESPYALVDASAAELVVAPPSAVLGVDDAADAERELTASGRYPIVALALGSNDLPRYEAVRGLSQTATVWDQAHLDAVDALTRRVAVAGVDGDPSATAVARSFERAFDRA
jgi:hypothetical protein